MRLALDLYWLRATRDTLPLHLQSLDTKGLLRHPLATVVKFVIRETWLRPAQF